MNSLATTRRNLPKTVQRENRVRVRFAAVKASIEATNRSATPGSFREELVEPPKQPPRAALHDQVREPPLGFRVRVDRERLLQK